MLAVQLGDAIAGAIVAAVATGAVTLLNTALGRRATRAKEAVASSTAQVDTAIAAMDGMKALAEQLRIERDEARRRIVELERDVREEHATATAMARLIDRFREGT